MTTCISQKQWCYKNFPSILNVLTKMSAAVALYRIIACLITEMLF